MNRSLSVVLMLVLLGPAVAEPLLKANGELTSRSSTLRTGEYVEVQKVSLQTGVLVSLKVAAEGFAPYVLVTTPEGRHFTQGVSGAEREVQLDFITTIAGMHQIGVTTEKAGQKGKYVLEGEARPLKDGIAGLKSLADVSKQLRPTDQGPGIDRPAHTHTVQIKAGQVVRVVVQSAAFDPVLVVTPPGGEMLKADDVADKNPEIDFVAEQDGALKVIILPADPTGQGPYRLQVSSGELVAPAAPPGAAILSGQGILGPGSAQLESGEWAALYSAKMAGGTDYVLQLEVKGFQPRILAVLPDGKQVDQRVSGDSGVVRVELTSDRSGALRLCIASQRSATGGTFRVNVQPKAMADAGAPASPVTPAEPRVPAPPRFQGAKLLNPKSPGLSVPTPQPLPATVQDPGVLSRTLHQMNYLSVEAGGWSEMDEQNWLYPKPGDVTHSSPRFFFTDPDNQFWNADTATNYTVPLQWQGNVFTCKHRRDLDAHGSFEMLDVAGTVSPDGSRVEWVTIREYVQEAYWDEKDKEALLRHRLYRSISLVDLPLRNPFYNPDTGAGPSHVTMQNLLKARPLDLTLRNGLHYGFNDSPEAGQHVLDLGYLEQDPAVRGAQYIDADKIHSVAYRSTNWAYPDGRSTAKLSFERRSNAR
ncbi:MAG: hypothetical protein ABFD96_14960 [Armatimonadia bacterium]